MVVSYEDVISDFLKKITEYSFLNLPASTRNDIVESYMKHAVQQFVKTCREELVGFNDEEETITMKNEEMDADEFIDVVTDGMVFYWFKQFMYKQDILELSMNTVDFTSYSPAELLKHVKNAYDQCKKDFTARLRKYSYDNGDLTDLHL